MFTYILIHFLYTFFLNLFLIGVDSLYNVVSAVQQGEPATSMHTSPPSRPPSHLHPTPLGDLGHRRSSLCSAAAPSAVCSAHGRVYTSQLLSVRPVCLFSASASLFPPCWWIQPYHFSRFHIYTSICNAHFSLTYFTQYNRAYSLSYRLTISWCVRIHIPSWKCSDFLGEWSQLLDGWVDPHAHPSPWTPRQWASFLTCLLSRDRKLCRVGGRGASQDSSVQPITGSHFPQLKSAANEAGKRVGSESLAPLVGFRSGCCSHAMVSVLLIVP